MSYIPALLLFSGVECFGLKIFSGFYVDHRFESYSFFFSGKFEINFEFHLRSLLNITIPLPIPGLVALGKKREYRHRYFRKNKPTNS